MAVSKEVFANCASCVIATNGYNGGSATGDAPTSGTTETWTMSTGNGSFPAAQTTNTPNTYFYVTDPADTTHEIIEVTDNSTPTTWHVTRGALSTATATHAAGATFVQVVSPGTLQNFKQRPGAYTGASSITVAGTTETILASYLPTSDELVAGSTWYGVAYGSVGPTLGSGTARVLTVRVMWGGSGSIGGTYTATGGTQLATITTGTNCPAFSSTTIASGGSFDINMDVSLFSTTQANCNLNMFYTTAASAASAQSTISVVNTASTTPWGSTGSPITISGSGPIFLTAKWGAAVTNGLVAVTPYIRSEA